MFLVAKYRFTLFISDRVNLKNYFPYKFPFTASKRSNYSFHLFSYSTFLKSFAT